VRYANVLFYVADPDAVAAARPVHRAYMADLKRQGKLAAGGPFDDLTGALFIDEAESTDEAERFAAEDPNTHARLIPQRIGCLCVGQMIRKWAARTQQTGPVGATPERLAYCPCVPALPARGTGRRSGRPPAWDAL
jgi:uncharacterized protein